MKKKVKKAKKKITKTKIKAKSKKAAPKKNKGPKAIARVEHFFGKIMVAAFRLKAPLKAGNYIHIKGFKTDFVQRVDSIQIEHQSVLAAKAGQDIGIKVKQKVREHDQVFLAKEKDLKPQAPVPKIIAIQKPMFPELESTKPKIIEQPKPMVLPSPVTKPFPNPSPGPQKKSDPYSGKKFLSF